MVIYFTDVHFDSGQAICTLVESMRSFKSHYAIIVNTSPCNKRTVALRNYTRQEIPRMVSQHLSDNIQLYIA